MFVRWKNRTLTRKNDSTPPERSLYAVIVKNQRIEGRTKQTVIKYLAHINESQVADPAHQYDFWSRAEQALAELRLESGARAEIEAKLATVVPRPGRNNFQWGAETRPTAAHRYQQAAGVHRMTEPQHSGM